MERIKFIGTSNNMQPSRNKLSAKPDILRTLKSMITRESILKDIYIHINFPAHYLMDIKFTHSDDGKPPHRIEDSQLARIVSLKDIDSNMFDNITTMIADAIYKEIIKSEEVESFIESMGMVVKDCKCGDPKNVKSYDQVKEETTSSNCSLIRFKDMDIDKNAFDVADLDQLVNQILNQTYVWGFCPVNDINTDCGLIMAKDAASAMNELRTTVADPNPEYGDLRQEVIMGSLANIMARRKDPMRKYWWAFEYYVSTLPDNHVELTIVKNFTTFDPDIDAYHPDGGFYVTIAGRVRANDDNEAKYKGCEMLIRSLKRICSEENFPDDTVSKIISDKNITPENFTIVTSKSDENNFVVF